MATITIRIDDKLMERIAEIAAREKRSRNKQIELILEEHLKETTENGDRSEAPQK